MPHALQPFALERYFSKYEFKAKHLLCCSDSQPLTMSDVVQCMDEDVKAQWDNLALGYTESRGLPALRHSIATSLYTTVSMDDILVAAPQEAIFLVMNSILQPDTDNTNIEPVSVVCMYPAYQSLYSIAESLGIAVHWWLPRESSDGENNHLYYSTEDLEKIVQGKNVKLIVVNIPNNPTGWLATHNEWIHIIDICKNKSRYPGGSFLFSDEVRAWRVYYIPGNISTQRFPNLFYTHKWYDDNYVQMYRGLEFHQKARLPAAVDVYQHRGISLSGMSKSLGAPGLRIGWLATKSKILLEKAAILKDYTTICSSGPSEILSLAILSKTNTILDQQMHLIRYNLKKMEDFAKKWNDLIQWNTPNAGTIAFPKFNLNNSIASVESFCEELVNTHGVMLLPASVYQLHADDCTLSPEEQQKISSLLYGRCRIGYGRENFPEVLQRFEEALLKMGFTPP